MSEKRDKKSAFLFFQQCIGYNGLQDKVTINKSGANKASIGLVNIQLCLFFMFTGILLTIEVRQIKYLNNILEQEHRHIKRITKPMLGFKSFKSGKATIAGIALQHMLRKSQHQQSKFQTIHEQFYNLAA